MNHHDYQYLREAREAHRAEIYRDLAGTYDHRPMSPSAQGRQNAKDESITLDAPITDEEDGE